MLKTLKLHGVGPVPGLVAPFGERLNLVTGDNGLGKSFLLDVCFWTLTGTWPGGRTAIPDADAQAPRIECEIQSKTKATSRESKYDFRTQTWSRHRGRPPLPGLVIYAAADGSFAVWDPARNYRWPGTIDRIGTSGQAESEGPEQPRAFQFASASPSVYGEGSMGRRIVRQDVANGLEEAGRVLCNGLIADWGEWFYKRSSEPAINPFAYLEEAISLLSHPQEPLRCEEPVKVFLDDSRKFPALRMPYSAVPHSVKERAPARRGAPQIPYTVVPYPHWSAGVRRIVNFAYLIVWAWVEHLQAADLRKEDTTDRIILIFDEVESHLHPKWQRTILPAILKVVDKLKSNVSVQVLAATHSPLVLASAEPLFNEDTDRLFWFDLHEGKVRFKMLPWAKYGDVVGWLTSPIFDLSQARSKEAEVAIDAAKAYMRHESEKLPEGLRTKEEIEARLKRLLDGEDPFLVRWYVSTEDHGE